jgi:predicted metal-dependent phosphoesterase TrpH
VPRRARAAGLAAIALTDHDTVAGVAEATRSGDALGIRVVSGCEFSVKAPWGELHVLGYFLPVGHQRLEHFLHETRDARRRRGEQMVAKLQHLGLEIDLEAVVSQAGGGALGRPHVARALVEGGFTTSVTEAFSRWLGRGRPAFVDKPLPEVERVTELVHAVGGLAIAAHLGTHGTDEHLRRFKEQGVDGIEVRHPSHSTATERRLLHLAQRLGMAISGGSDWHGEIDPGEHHAPLGASAVPLEWLERLEQRRSVIQS